VPRVTRATVKKVPVSRNPKRSKKAKEPEVSLEAHESVASPPDVINFSITHSPLHTLALLYSLLSLGFVEQICRLGH
jgi:hypothetical protein